MVVPALELFTPTRLFKVDHRGIAVKNLDDKMRAETITVDHMVEHDVHYPSLPRLRQHATLAACNQHLVPASPHQAVNCRSVTRRRAGIYAQLPTKVI